MKGEDEKNIELSVVVLCYRAEDLIVPFVKQLKKELQDEQITNHELVLVANYDKSSEDKTPEIVAALATEDPSIRVIAKQKEGRMGWDMRLGLEAARGEYIAVIDGDGQMPVSDIPLVYNVIKSGKYDIVKTYRAKRHDGLMRAILSKGYNFLFKMLFHPYFPIIDINSKPKVLTREAFQKMHLQSNDWFTDSEIMLEAFKNNMRICEVSTIFYKNERRKSFVKPATIFEFIWNLFYNRFVINRYR